MDAKRRQQQPQQQLCVQALHHQQMGAHCVPPMGYPASPWVLWDGGHLMEIARRRKKKKRLYTACLLAGIAVVVFAVAGVAGLAVYLGGSPPTENSATWESFRKAGEARYGEDSTTHRLLGRHGVLLRADMTTERTTQPARSPWSIRRDQGLGRWEGRGGGGEEEPQDTVQKMKDDAIELEDPIDLSDEYSEGIPEVEVVLDSAAIEPTGDASEAIENLQSQPHRSPHARASEVVETPTTFEPGGDDHKDVTVTPKGETERPVGSTGVEVVTTISIRESSVRKGGEKDREEEDDVLESDIFRRYERRRGESEWGGAPMEDSNEEDEGSVEGLVEEDKRRGGEERRYEQLQVSNKAASGGVPVFNILTKILNRVNTSSGHKEVDTSDKNHTNNGTMECSIGEFRCSAPNGGVMCLPGSSRCDGARDCFLNGEDEIGCTCADTLRSRFLHRKLCDGVPDCWDYSDEDQCDWCSPGHLVCGGGSRTCVEPERICDGAKDCPGGDDEARCIALFPEEVHKEAKMMGAEGRRFYHRGSNWNGTTRGSDYVTASMITNEVLPYRSSGYLLVRKKGVWGKLCMDSPTSNGMKTKDDVKEKHWGVAEIGHEVCKAMTHRDFEMIEQVPDDDIYEGQYSKQTSTPYYKIQGNSSQNDILGSTESLQTTECSSKKVIRVTCRDLECGVRPKVKVNQWSRIVGGGNAAPGAWPWQAALYREGEFQCGATLISDHWLVSAGHCFFRAPDDYWVARMGTLRRGTALPSPHEQRRPVSTIVLHPGYVDEGFLNDIALLRLSSPVEITDHVRPVCLPPRTTHISTTTFRYPDITSSPHGEEKDLDHVPTGEGISYMYDEANTMLPSLLNSYESIQEELNTDIPYAHEIMSEFSTVLTEENNTGASNNSSGELRLVSTTESVLKQNFFNSTRGNHIVPGQSSMINRNDELQQEIVGTSPYSSNTNIPVNDDELNLEQSTSMTSPFDHQISENETPDDYSTESMAGHTVTELTQHMNTQPITEEIDLKELIREVSSLFLSTNSRPLYNNAASKNRNTILTMENKGKHGGVDESVDEVTKITFPHEHSSTDNQSHHGQSEGISVHKKNGTISLESANRGEISDSNIKDHAVEVSKKDAIETENLKNEVSAEEKIAQKFSPDAIEVTTQNNLKMEQVHDKYSNHIKNPHETLNVLLSNDKIVETKYINRTSSVDDHTADVGAYVNENSTQAKSVSPDTVIFTLEDAVASVVKVGSELEGGDRKIRNAEQHEGTDDGTDDGIRNGRLCTVVGWGQLFEVGKIFPDTLQEVQLPLISTRECRKRTIFLPLYHLTDAMFCAGYDNGGRDACLGDSGGPLMCQEPDGHWSLYGVTSNGYGCARVNRPGVYTKVSHYIPWMEETMLKEDSAQEEKRKREEENWREGGEELWRREWRKRRGEDGTGGKHHCPHRCPLGECLQKARVCNGVVDCSDASDEQNCYNDTKVGR